ncbi:PilZ domain protein [Caloramator mitchellensis]|uniref:PilZ domain protein n=1 Tax=Caloramator mitchellensis TaxID=908809 RepID=A0A0R3JT56_CALMK|nr:PilZ domain-containing protein [Caloramator mitchellensis]KRQ86707.1 PilZ domain protein [Caloramator mitchellensis]
MEALNRRKFDRVPMDCEILYPTIFLNDDKKTFLDEDHKLNVCDVSEAGICVRSNFFIPVGSFLSFYFRVESNIPFKALVKIIWNKAEYGEYFAGGEFIALKSEEMKILVDYVEMHKKD